MRSHTLSSVRAPGLFFHHHPQAPSLCCRAINIDPFPSGGPAHGRIIKNNRRRSALMNCSTLHPTVTTVRMELDIDELTMQTIPTPSTLSLLRLRARELRARRVRLLRCLRGIQVHPFRWISPEGNGDTQHCIGILNRCIAFDVHWNHIILGDVKDCARARERLFRADRSRRNYADFLRSPSNAVNVELSRRQRTQSEGANSQVIGVREAHYEGGDARARSAGATVDISPEQYRIDNERIERRMRMEELGLREPTANEKRQAARTRALINGEFESVMELDKHNEFRLSVARARRKRKNDRRRVLRAYNCAMEVQRAVPDPRSDDDDDSAPMS